MEEELLRKSERIQSIEQEIRDRTSDAFMGGLKCAHNIATEPDLHGTNAVADTIMEYLRAERNRRTLQNEERVKMAEASGLSVADYKAFRTLCNLEAFLTEGLEKEIESMSHEAVSAQLKSRGVDSERLLIRATEILNKAKDNINVCQTSALIIANAKIEKLREALKTLRGYSREDIGCQQFCDYVNEVAEEALSATKPTIPSE